MEPAPASRAGLAALRRVGFAALALAAVAVSAFALARIGIGDVSRALGSVRPAWVVVASLLMAASMGLRAEAWYAIVSSALPRRMVRRADVARATMIGVFMSAVLPGRIGEAGRVLVLSRRLGRESSQLPVVVGTLFSQTLLNMLGLLALVAVAFAGTRALQADAGAIVPVAVVPAVLLVGVMFGPGLAERFAARGWALGKASAALAVKLSELRRGLLVFRRASATSHALLAQLGAWGLQLLSVYALLVAFRLQGEAGVAAAAAVLAAVNLAGIVPVTPSNVGIFQAACVLVLVAWGVGTQTALAYGLVLQAIEVAVAVAVGLPALAGEHSSLRDIRRRAAHIPAPIP